MTIGRARRSHSTTHSGRGITLGREAEQSIYGAFADTYATFSEYNGPNAGYDRPAILQLAGEVAEQRALELRCAGRALTEHLVDRGADVLALDREPRMVDLARQRVGEHARVAVAELEQPLEIVPTSSMDVAVASLVLHYIADWAPVLDELHRCLVPGGVFAFSIHHPITGWARSDHADDHRTELISEDWDWDGQPVTGTLYRRPLSAIFGPLRQAGFTIDSVDEPRPHTDIADPHDSDDPQHPTRLSLRPGATTVRLTPLRHLPHPSHGPRWTVISNRSGNPWRVRRMCRSPIRRVGSSRCGRLTR